MNQTFRSTAACVLTIMCMSTVLAQTPPSGASSTDAMPASGQMTKKQMHKQDRALSRAVYTSIEKVKNINMSRITVLSKNGSVTLVGNVLQDGDVGKAGDAATNTPGVMHVDNRLIVGERGGH